MPGSRVKEDAQPLARRERFQIRAAAECLGSNVFPPDQQLILRPVESRACDGRERGFEVENVLPVVVSSEIMPMVTGERDWPTHPPSERDVERRYVGASALERIQD